jgi:hypothetical protein
VKHLILTLTLVTMGCATDHDIGGEAFIRIDPIRNTISIVNPIVEFCERLYPEILYPNEYEREIEVTSCMKLCSESGACAVDVGSIEGLLPGTTE